MDKITEITEQLKAALQDVSAIAGTAENEEREFTAEERATVTARMNEARDLKAKLTGAKSDAKTRQAIAELGEGIELVESKQEKRTPTGLIVPSGQKSIGQHFVESAEYKTLLASAPNGVFQEKQRVQSLPVGFKALVTGSSDTSAGALIQPDWRGLQVGMDAFQRPLMLRDVVTPGTTGSDIVEYARVVSLTNSAAPVPEATATTGAGIAAGVKPESAFTTVKVNTPVKTIAHWIPVTKRALSDAAQVRTLIDSFLRYGLEEELEDQMISGDGTGENFEGLANVSGVQTQPWETNLLTTLRKAKTKVRTIGRSIANAYVINPVDKETVDLLQDNEGRYYFGGPASQGEMPLWNLPAIESEAVPAGTAYVGDWRKAILWDREQASITMTDSHADFFVRNLVAILAEMRAAFGILQPSAFVKIDLTEA